ncbi:MAG: MraY family glycosyltransferase [bacterium]
MRFPTIAFLIALLISYFLTPFVRKIAISSGVIDQPDARRVHKEPTPRWGGLAIYAGVLFALTIVNTFGYIWDKRFVWHEWSAGLMLIGGLIVLMGALDDKYQFSAITQMLFLLCMGVVVQLFGVQIQGISKPFAPSKPDYDAHTMWLALGGLTMPITAIWIFVVTKTMDTIDGLDGLAAGVGAIAAAAIALLALQARQPEVALLSAAGCGAAVGFLKHNYNPAKIFMGTGGSQFLGFLLAGLAIIGTYKTITVVVMAVSLLVFGLPLIDAFVVVLRRLRSGQPIYKADKRHLHHQLLDIGLNQRQAVLILYAVAIALGITAVLIFKFARAH